MMADAFINHFIDGIIRRSQGILSASDLEILRAEIRHRVYTPEWLFMGLSDQVINKLIRVGDHLLKSGDAGFALTFYREASYLFPHLSVCYIREAWCQVKNEYFGQAKKACLKAIQLSDGDNLEEILSIILVFMANNRLQEANEMCLKLVSMFPQNSHFRGLVQKIENLREAAVAEARNEETMAEKRKEMGEASGETNQSTKKDVKKFVSAKEMDEAPGETDQCTKKDVKKIASAKSKSLKQLRKEQSARNKEIETAIEKAKEEQEKKREEQELEERERRKRKEEEEKLRKEVEEAEEAAEKRKRKEREQREKLEKRKDDEIRKQEKKKKKKSARNKFSTSSGDCRVTNPQATGSQKSASSSAVPSNDKVALGNMSNVFDQMLANGSPLRRVCPKCNTPRVFSHHGHACHVCGSELVVWHRKNETREWAKVRLPPKEVISAPFVQCKHFMQGKRCLRNPCNFAHGEEELEIWEICRSKGVTRKAKSVTSTTCGQEMENNSRERGIGKSKRSVSSSKMSWSFMPINEQESGRPRTDSLSSTHSSVNKFDALNSGDVLDVFGSDSEYSSCVSQDVLDESGQESVPTARTSSILFLSDVGALPGNEESVESNTSKVSEEPAKTGQSEDDGWTTVGSNKVEKDLSKSVSSGIAIYCLCSECRNKISTAEEPEIMMDTRLCKHCNRTVKPAQVYWNTHARQYIEIRRKPDGIKNVRMCWHFLRDNVHFMQDCTFAHGEYEKILWEKELNRGKPKRAEVSSGLAAGTANEVTYTLRQFILEQRCTLCDISFSSEAQLKHHYSDARHKISAIKRAQPFWREQLDANLTSKCRPPPDGVQARRYRLCRRFEQGPCYLNDKCTFAHGQEELFYWERFLKQQNEHFAQLAKQKLLAESFSEKVRRRMRDGRPDVLKESLPGITLKCSSPFQVELSRSQDQLSQDHLWIFDVGIETTGQLMLSEVAFLWETHLDKFQFIRTPEEKDSPGTQSIPFLEDDFVEYPSMHKAAVQFCVQFSSDVLGNFRQKLLFDFGNDMILSRLLNVSVVSEEICISKDEYLPSTTFCRILEWSEEEMELVGCKDFQGMDPDGLCEKYKNEDALPDPAEIGEFTRNTYCKQWHDVLFHEEQYIEKEVSRYDISNGSMRVIDHFQSSEEAVFATSGELFGEIYLEDYLLMDEISGHLISRSVMSVILRPKDEQFRSKRIYECSIKLKTSQLVVIKLNEALLKDCAFEKDQQVNIDLKFKYNRLPMCEMHEAIDMCERKTEVLIPDIKNVSYKDKKSMPDWFMDRKPNSNQHEAIAMILDPSPTPPILVIGPFGTGKTFTMSLACVAILNKSEPNKVLICTHSNSAADIHLSHLDERIQLKGSKKIRPLRVLNLYRKVQTVPANLRRYCLIEDSVIREPSENDLHEHNVIITTLATARVLWKFFKRAGTLHFTHILIDEAAQALEPECVTPLVMADEKTKIALAGDHKQMGPPVYSKSLWPDEVHPRRSLLERLFHRYEQHRKAPASDAGTSSENESIPYAVVLTENYRCHAKILEFPSDCFYGGQLVPKGDQSTHESIPVLSFYAAHGVDKQVEGGLAYYNDAEVDEVVIRVDELVERWPKDWPRDRARQIGVLTPYRDQVRRIRDGLRKKGLGDVNVETVENVQGKEFKALFISTVRTLNTCLIIENRNSDPAELDFGFLSDDRFLNTAVTRAQSLLAVVGDPLSLCSVGACRNLWKDYLQRCKAINGLRGCTLKTIMDFCLRSQVLDPSAHEFTPCQKVENPTEENLESVSPTATLDVSTENESNGSGSMTAETEPINGASSASCDSTSNAIATQNAQPAEADDVEDGVRNDDAVGGIGVDEEDDLGVKERQDSEPSTAENDLSTTANEENEETNESEIDQLSATNIFFRRDSDENFDKIIEELVKACQETKKKDAAQQQNAANMAEDFPLLSEQVPTSSAPHWPNVSINRTFSAGLRDGRIELGFHVTGSEVLFRLTGGKLSSAETGNQSFHSSDACSSKELLELLKGKPSEFKKCTFRIDTGGRQRRRYGELPTPDSPDIYIPGRVRGVFEDDIVVLQLLSSAKAGGKEGEKENIMLGCIKGVLRRLIEPEERQFVCTVDRTQTGVMLPIDKSSPKLMNFTKTDEENIIPIFTMEGNAVKRAKILKGKLYEEALAGERVFVVKYLKWRTDCPFPLGLAVRHMPHGRDLKTGMKILYEEHNIKREFGEASRTAIKRDFQSTEDWQIPGLEKGRVSYRDHVFTIDPPESKDLDDAISIRSLGNGHYELHVHIADVAYFVKPNTALDEEARLRGTSYYPPKPDETVPMLPRELSEGCCSLLQGKDRLAVTLIVEITADGTVVGEAKIVRSVVRSSRRLTYKEAQEIINETTIRQTDCLAHEEEEPNNETSGRHDQQANLPQEPEVPLNKEGASSEVNNVPVEERRKKKMADEHKIVDGIHGKVRAMPVKEAIGVIHRIAKVRRISRLGVERSFYHRKSDDYDDSETEAHGLIEEIMIMANHLVAKYLLERFPTCTPLRAQPPPKTRRVMEWKQRFDKFLNFSLGLERLGDSELVQEGKIELKVPYTTWNMIKSQLQASPGSNFDDLVKLVCDLDLFPQLAMASAHQQRIQRKARYICSGEALEDVKLSLERHEGASANKENVSSDVSSNWLPADDTNLSNDNEQVVQHMPSHVLNSACADDTPSTSNSVIEGVRDSLCSSDEQNVKNVQHRHSSLSLDAYCHFTSPIRRYIDITVHRLVVAGIENGTNTIDAHEMTTLCDRCTFLARNASRFERDAKKLQVAVKLQNSLKFVSVLIDEVARDSLKLFFGPGEYELVRGLSVRIAQLGPDKDPEESGNEITLQWKFRFLRLSRKGGLAQPSPNFSEEEVSEDIPEELERKAEAEEVSNLLEVSEDDYDFDFTVNGELWIGVLDAVKKRNEDLLRTQLQKVEEIVQKQGKREKEKSTKVSLLERVQCHPSTNTFAPYKPPHVGQEEASMKETDDSIEVTKSLGPYTQVKVQLCSQVTRGILAPAVQLFQITDKIHACVQHRNSPTTCFASTPYKRPSDIDISDISEYIKLWKPVLMMEIATSAVRENDVVTLSNLRVSFARGSDEKVSLHFDLSTIFCDTHDLAPLDLNLMCVRVKDPRGSGKDAGYWVGHFQIMKELAKKEEGEEIKEEAEKRATAKKDSIQAVAARLIHSSTPVPEPLITQKFCYITAELISLNIPDRRRLGALEDSVVASELVQDICTGKVSGQLGVGPVDDSSVPKDLSLCNVHPTLRNFYPLNRYQKRAIHTALNEKFTLIQGPPGTGKTVTGVHIAYWFAQLNRKRLPTVNEDGEKCKGSVVFYCGPSNKSVDVVARYLIKIPGLKILRIYGQEIERKVFPVPDKVTTFRSKRIAVQLKADEELKEVSLHHVIRSPECPFAEELKEYDQQFKEFSGSNAPLEIIKKFNKVKSDAEKWAITKRGVNVILTTCTTTYSPRILSSCEEYVSQCIVDECGMCIEAETLCAMLGSNAKQIVLIGDHKQLQPIIQCDKAKDLGLGISMFERYSQYIQMLEIQYRMHEELCRFPSEFFYNDTLKTAEQVKNREPDNVNWPNGKGYPFVFHHIEGVEESLVVKTDQGNENSKKNQEEIAKVVHVARKLTNEGVKGEDIVVLSPYRAQCYEVTEKLKTHGMSGISVMSVVAAQGSEKNYVILSLVRSRPWREIEQKPSRSWLMENLGFVTDEHQINVALTRAKRGLCIIGNANLLAVNSMWRALLEHYQSKGCLQSDYRHFKLHEK